MTKKPSDDVRKFKPSDVIPELEWDNKKIKYRWDLLKPEDIEYIDGDKEMLIEALQQAYGYSDTQVILEVNQWLPQLTKDKK